MCWQSLMKFYYCLFKILRKTQNVVDKELQRAVTLKELAPSPYFSIINVHLVDINETGKFYEILSLPFQDIEKPKHCRRLWKQYKPPQTVCGGYKQTRGLLVLYCSPECWGYVKIRGYWGKEVKHRSWAGADISLGPKVWCQHYGLLLWSFVASLKKNSSTSDFIHIFSCFNKCI